MSRFKNRLDRLEAETRIHQRPIIQVFVVKPSGRYALSKNTLEILEERHPEKNFSSEPCYTMEEIHEIFSEGDVDVLDDLAIFLHVEREPQPDIGL